MFLIQNHRKNMGYSDFICNFAANLKYKFDTRKT